MAYQETLRQHRRLAILRHLEQVSDYTSNVSILTDVLDALGVTSSRDQVVTEVTWLEQNGFVTANDTAGFIVVEATHSGVDIARGRATHPDIRRPTARKA